MYRFPGFTEIEEPKDFRGTKEALVNSEKMLVPRIPHKINDSFNTEFEEPLKYH